VAQCDKINDKKKCPVDCTIKSFMIVIYDHNDSGQFYKTMITIVIYDHS
jgi:hypothetical protein